MRIGTVRTLAAALCAAAIMVSGRPAVGQTVVAISMSPQTLIGGNPSTGAVRLNVAAPSGGAVVALASSDTAAATVPSSVTVGSGATIAHFPIATFGVSSTHFPVITATLNGAVSVTMQVWRAYINTVGVSATAVMGSNPATGTVYLNGQAPPGGLLCTLSTSAACAQVPASVTVPAGATSATFTITTTPVTANTPLTVYATALGSTRGVGFKVLTTHITSLALNPAIIIGGQSSTATITLAAPAPAGGLACAITLPETAVNSYSSYPSTVTVPAGSSSTTFTINTTFTYYKDFAGTMYATAYGSTRGAGIEVVIPQIKSWSVTPNPVQGGGSVTVTITLFAPGPHNIAWGVAPAQDSAIPPPYHYVLLQPDSTYTVLTATVPVGFTSVDIQTYLYVNIGNSIYNDQNPTAPLTILHN